jgi:hypothetical protein
VWADGDGREVWAFDVSSSGGPSFPGRDYPDVTWRFAYEQPAGSEGDFVETFCATFGYDSVFRGHDIQELIPPYAPELDRGSFDVFAVTGAHIGVAASFGDDIPGGGTDEEWWAFSLGAPMPSSSNPVVRWRIRYRQGSYESGESQAQFIARAAAALVQPFFREHDVAPFACGGPLAARGAAPAGVVPCMPRPRRCR